MKFAAVLLFLALMSVPSLCCAQVTDDPLPPLPADPTPVLPADPTPVLPADPTPVLPADPIPLPAERMPVLPADPTPVLPNPTPVQPTDPTTVLPVNPTPVEPPVPLPAPEAFTTTAPMAFQNTESYERIQFRASYLLWWLNRDSANLPVLTTGSAGNGVLGKSDTVVLLRAGDVGPSNPFSGGDFGFHYWFDQEQWFGVDARFLFLAKNSADYVAGGNASGSPLLSIPFNDLNAALPGPSFTQIANPGASTGQVRFESTSQMWGYEISFDLPSFAWDRLSVSGLVGFRYMDLAETYSIDQNVSSIGGQQLLSFRGTPIPANNSLQIYDAFDTHNQFFGGNFIVRVDYQLTQTISLEFTSKTALGETFQTLDVAGSTTQLSPGGHVVNTANGGLFAQPYNSGHRVESSFSVIPELEGRLAWDVTRNIQLTAGYNFLYWTNVLRPASQIPGTINTTTAPSQATFGGGGPIPGFEPFHLSGLMAQGLTLGLTLRF